MKSLVTVIICFCLAGGFNISSHAQGSADEAITIGNVDGNEVIVHVYRKKEDPFPFIEFSVIIDESSGQPTIEITEVEGKTTTGGFMIITGVTPAADIGVTRSDRYEISFQRVNDYKIYERAVMDYLRRLPVPEIDIEVTLDETEEIQVFEPEEEEMKTVDLGDIVMDPLLDVENESPDETLITDDLSNLEELEDIEPLDVFALKDTNSSIVHVHRDENDIDPFKEFLVTLYRDEIGRKKAKVVEVRGVKSGTRLIIMTGFEDKGEEGILQSFSYDVNSYNVEDSDIHEQAVIEYMKGLTSAQFDGTEETIKDGWEDALNEKEPEVEQPVVHLMPEGKKRKKKTKEISQRELDKMAKEAEKAKYKAPKYKYKYGKRKSGKMSSRMAKFNKKKTSCPSIRSRK